MKTVQIRQACENSIYDIWVGRDGRHYWRYGIKCCSVTSPCKVSESTWQVFQFPTPSSSVYAHSVCPSRSWDWYGLRMFILKVIAKLLRFTGGAERLVVDAALGLQDLGHTVHIYTSYHDPTHAFSETTDGTLKVICPYTPFPRNIRGAGHILFAHLRQLNLTLDILLGIGGTASKEGYDVFFVDQLSTCVPLLRWLGRTRVIFYCHFPDKLLSDGAFVEGQAERKMGSLLKRIYRMPMDWLEEVTTRKQTHRLLNTLMLIFAYRTVR